MSLEHATFRAYGFEIPNTTNIELLDQLTADLPDNQPANVGYTCLNNYERIFLYTFCEYIKPNTAVRITDADYTRPEIPAWTANLRAIAARLGHDTHDEPAWLILRDYS